MASSTKDAIIALHYSSFVVCIVGILLNALILFTLLRSQLTRFHSLRYSPLFKPLHYEIVAASDIALLLAAALQLQGNMESRTCTWAAARAGAFACACAQGLTNVFFAKRGKRQQYDATNYMMAYRHLNVEGRKKDCLTENVMYERRLLTLLFLYR